MSKQTACVLEPLQAFQPMQIVKHAQLPEPLVVYANVYCRTDGLPFPGSTPYKNLMAAINGMADGVKGVIKITFDGENIAVETVPKYQWQ